ncbi:hypothetical protein C0J52_00067 [Blattella germanica]|nr:hypothetical protein C0J52_00067 [Blattella germanica]
MTMFSFYLKLMEYIQYFNQIIRQSHLEEKKKVKRNDTDLERKNEMLKYLFTQNTSTKYHSVSLYN